jgi:hypothetical protein
MPAPPTTLTLRMLTRPGRDLHGYIFSDLDHARRWLRQAFVKRAEIKLEYIEIGDFHRCPRCNGEGSTRSEKPTGRLTTVDAFLNEPADE